MGSWFRINYIYITARALGGLLKKLEKLARLIKKRAKITQNFV